MVGLLGEEPDPNDERDRVGERRPGELLHDHIGALARARTAPRPPGKLGERRRDLGVGESRGCHQGIVACRAAFRETAAVPLDLPDAPAPDTLELDRERGLTLVWSDGSTAEFTLEELRVNCPCAECRGLREQELPAWPKPTSPRPLVAVTGELVGAWGLTITWNDGHATGIYPWGLFRAWRGLPDLPAGS
jgi:DUF971 family protein/ribosomal protein S14